MIIYVLIHVVVYVFVYILKVIGRAERTFGNQGGPNAQQFIHSRGELSGGVG